MQLIQLLQVCLDSDKNQFIACMGEVGGMLGRAGADENPEMKQKMAAFSANLCRELPKNAGNYMRTAVLAMVANLQHQHSKVRKGTLRGMQPVLIAQGAEQFMVECFNQFRYTQNDRSADVRRIFYEVLCSWMVEMEISSLIGFESNFVLYLLNGVSDECEEIAQKCKSFLEEHGARMKQALVALGDEKDDKEDQEMIDVSH